MLAEQRNVSEAKVSDSDVIKSSHGVRFHVPQYEKNCCPQPMACASACGKSSDQTPPLRYGVLDNYEKSEREENTASYEKMFKFQNVSEVT